jgi:hypothetical protein
MSQHRKQRGYDSQRIVADYLNAEPVGAVPGLSRIHHGASGGGRAGGILGPLVGAGSVYERCGGEAGVNEEVINLVARVLAWSEGGDPAEVEVLAREVGTQDLAQQCCEDLGLLP